MRLCGQRVGKEDKEVYLSFHDLRSDLLVSAQRTTVISFYRQRGSLCDQPGSGSGSAEEMFLQNLLILIAPLNKLLFLIIMGDQRNILLFLNRQSNRFLCHSINPFL